MVPSKRWENMLGVERFDKLPEYVGEYTDFNRVEISLRQHIGAPSVALVQDGAKVQAGEKIAESAEGLSLPQHASISGTVGVYDGKIIISRV